MFAATPHRHAKAAPAGPVEKGPVTLTPALVEAGSPELIRVTVANAEKVEGEWVKNKIDFFRAPGSSTVWYALAGLDVEAALGTTKLKITARLKGSQTQDLSREVVVHAAHYTTGSLTVAPKFVEPGPEEQQQIAAAVKDKQRAFAVSDAEGGKPLWSGSFVAPVKAEPTASFGTRRMFNGKLASVHKGMDFRAPSGTPVKAGNSGKVLLAEPLYYEGNCVMIDHGMGLVSISMHLSRIDVKPGDQIATGQQIGLSGATGRVTGPHLHWAIRWKGNMLDPAKLLRLRLDGLVR